jgi:glucosyl-dolichyl phosphate glucuronosyltransferase
MDISVVLCSYNGAASLGGALASFKQLSVPRELSWELILIDNNSTDSTWDIMEEFARTSGFDVRCAFEAKQGRSFALNKGIRRTSGKIIAFTDDDVTVDPQYLAGLAYTFATFDCIGIGGRIVPVWNQSKPAWLEIENQQVVGHFEYGDEPKEINLPPIGANMAFRRAAFEKYGLFRTELGVNKSEIGGTEDDEFGRRLLKAGEKIFYAPHAVIYLTVESHRLTKQYFLRWFYSMGKANIRARMWPQDAVCYFGVPRYIFRSLFENSFRWAVTMDEKLRFHYKLHAYRAVGAIREAFRREGAAKMEIPRL